MFLIILALIAGASAGEPFWRAKDKVYSRIREREIVVSVKTEPMKKPLHRLVVAGGGQMRAPCDFAFRAAQDYEALAKQSDYIEEARYTPEKNELFVKISAYGYTQSNDMRIEAGKDGAFDAIFYEILSGRMKGFKGRFVFYPVAGQEAGALCDIGTAGEVSYEKLPLPKIFVTFGMEVMFQRMAGRLRAYAEENYRKRAR